jgi:hypothetical protein
VRAARGREVEGDLLVELAGDQLLPHGVPQAPEAGQPRIGAAGETGDAGQPGVQSLAPRATCGFGSRIRRICSVRISP